MEESVATGVGSAARDLHWYFTRTDAGPLKSNFGAMVHRLAMGRARSEAPVGAEDDDMLEAAARAGGVARVLHALDPDTVEVLWRAFGAEWPDELGPLGELAALAPLTGAARRAHQRSGTPLPLPEWLAGQLAVNGARRHAATWEAIRRSAAKLRARALAAYLSQRRRVGHHA
jgi:hypothetical protein